nr:MAG TPA: hypothetical protein [Caudoviricetes sp.]
MLPPNSPPAVSILAAGGVFTLIKKKGGLWLNVKATDAPTI